MAAEDYEGYEGCFEVSEDEWRAEVELPGRFSLEACRSVCRQKGASYAWIRVSLDEIRVSLDRIRVSLDENLG